MMFYFMQNILNQRWPLNLVEYMTANIVVSMLDGTRELIAAGKPASMVMAKIKFSICMEPAFEVLHQHVFTLFILTCYLHFNNNNKQKDFLLRGLTATSSPEPVS